jgi:hypothetical protein
MSSIFVGLVQHDDLHAAHHQRAAPHVVERASRRGDHDVDAGAHRVDLPADRLPAVDRQHAHVQRLAVAMHRFGHLHRELARRHQHHGERARGARAGHAAGRDETLEDGQREGRGLSGAGGGLAEEVASFDQGRDGLLLDGRGLFVAQDGEGLDDAGIEPQRRKAFVLLRWLGHPRILRVGVPPGGGEKREPRDDRRQRRQEQRAHLVAERDRLARGALPLEKRGKLR